MGTAQPLAAGVTTAFLVPAREPAPQSRVEVPRWDRSCRPRRLGGLKSKAEIRGGPRRTPTLRPPRAPLPLASACIREASVYVFLLVLRSRAQFGATCQHLHSVVCVCDCRQHLSRRLKGNTEEALLSKGGIIHFLKGVGFEN